MQERRRSDRCPIDMFVEERVGERTFLHPAINLSADGIYILSQSGRKIIDGTQLLTIAFTLPSGQSITTSGRVVYVDDRGGQLGIGIRFSELSTTDQAAIDSYISQNAA